MKLLLFTATLGLTAAFNASLERRTPSRRALAALKASQMEAFERAVECAGEIRDQMSRVDMITYLSPSLLDSHLSTQQLSLHLCHHRRKLWLLQP